MAGPKSDKGLSRIQWFCSKSNPALTEAEATVLAALITARGTILAAIIGALAAVVIAWFALLGQTPKQKEVTSPPTFQFYFDYHLDNSVPNLTDSYNIEI